MSLDTLEGILAPDSPAAGATTDRVFGSGTRGLTESGALAEIDPDLLVSRNLPKIRTSTGHSSVPWRRAEPGAHQLDRRRGLLSCCMSSPRVLQH